MKIILFDSIAAAQEIAYMLRGEWDGLNAVTIENFDRSAFDLAIGLCDINEWCFEGDYTGENDLDIIDIEKVLRKKLTLFKLDNTFLKTNDLDIINIEKVLRKKLTLFKLDNTFLKTNDLDVIDIEKVLRKKLTPFKFTNLFPNTSAYQIKIDWIKYEGDDMIFPS